MPNMDSLTLVRKLKELPQYSLKPILVLTTEKTNEIKAKSKAVNATGRVTKPFVPEQLLKAVNTVLSIQGFNHVKF